MPSPHSIEYVEEFLLNSSYKLLSKKYVNQSTILDIEDKNGYRYSMSLMDFKSLVKYSVKSFFHRFHKSNSFSIYNLILYIEKNNIPCKYVRGKYISARDNNLCFSCSCGNLFFRCLNNLVGSKQYFCLDCAISNSRESKKNSYEDILFRLEELSITPLDIKQYKNSKSKMDVKCNTCGHEWKRIFSSMNVNYACPACSFSKGEKKIYKMLRYINIDFISQKEFSDCKYKENLPFDFYLPEFNLCIEYQGEQHYKPVDFKGEGKNIAKSNFIVQKKRDRIKARYCKDNNIPLLIIPYTEFERIEEIISSFLKI